MNKVVTITPLPGSKCDVVISIGNQQTRLPGLPVNKAELQIRLSIIGRINRYIKHRQTIMTKYGGYVDMRRSKSLQSLMTRMGTSDRWTTLNTARQIKLMKEDMIAIMPGLASRFYEDCSEMIRDLQAWANDYEIQHMAHYGSNQRSA